MYNFHVQSHHNYYVLAGDRPILVHNSNGHSGAAKQVITAGKIFKDHFIRHKGLLSAVTGKSYRKLKDHGPEFLADLTALVDNGTLKHVGLGTLKAGMDAGNIFRGEGLTLVTKVDGEFWTLLKSGEGLDKAIQMIE